MDIDTILLDTEDRMEKAMAALERDFQKLRTGRATTALVDGIKADYYGTPTPISQMASVAVPDSRTITIQPWDKGGISVVEKAILKSDLGLTPVNDGRIIRINIPPLTEERRKELVKVARKYTEDAKVAVRNVRRDANDSLKKLEKEKTITEDEQKKAEAEVQKLTDKFVADADKRSQAKEKEIMDIECPPSGSGPAAPGRFPQPGQPQGHRAVFFSARSCFPGLSSPVQRGTMSETLTHLPVHLAIIMDGNGRWAQARGLPREAGHRAGAETVRTIVTECRRLGIRHLTLYTFSSENWSRPKTEVSALFSLLLEFLGQEVPRMEREGIRLNILGDMEALPLAARTALRHGLRRTAANTDMVLNLALNYGGRAELVRAVRSMMAEGLRPEDVTEQSLADHLYTAGQPDPDFLIRTSGEQRLSNYLLYQCAYSEFYFTPTPWPDFGVEALHEALAVYAGRSRRFGKTQEQINGR